MFDAETIRFLADLAANNDRGWFQENKARYEAHLKAPAAAFATSLAALLTDRYGVDASARIFRIHRDLRFSKDKTPYNTHVHVSFSDPTAGAAWMVGLEVDRLVLGYGAFALAGVRLDRWRAAVAGPAGEGLLADLRSLPLRLDPPELKRVPAPYEGDHPTAELLRRKGLAVWLADLPAEAAFGEDAPARLIERLAILDPVRSCYARILGKQ